VDRDGEALASQARLLTARFPSASVRCLRADLMDELTIGPMDGIVMANALHFIHERELFRTRLTSWIRPGGRFILVEYDSDRGNPWVPHALSWDTWHATAERAGFGETQLIGRLPSRFLGSIYASLSVTSVGPS